jgi:hypothetical protein
VALDAAVAHWRTLRPNAAAVDLEHVQLRGPGRRVPPRVGVAEDLIRVLVEDGYRRLAGEVEVEFGDIVVYEDDDGK